MARILLIDDDPAILQVQALLLRREGHEVATADNGGQAMLLIQANPFDLVITDLIMPEKEGMETIMQLRRQYPSVRIIASSGGGRSDAEGYLRMAQMMGAHATLSKPFTRDDLLDAVARALGGSDR